jgi:Carboxypeptidase regulatory-like domain
MKNPLNIQPIRVWSMLLLLLSSLCALAQTPNASLSGVVKDAGGQGVSGVKLTLRNSATGTDRSTLSDDAGRYHLANLDPGNYELRAEREGFSTEVREGMVLSVGSSLVMDVILHSGQTKEVIVASQKAPLIEANKAELSRVVSQDSIDSLPILGRNFVDFAKLSSGVGQGRENTGGGAQHQNSRGWRGQLANLYRTAPRYSFAGGGAGVPRVEQHRSG